MLPLPPATMYLASSFVWGFLFWMMATVSMIYQIEMANLTPLELILVGTALEVSAFLFEIPTGLLADTVSRRLSVVVGYFVTGIAFVLAASFPVFWVIALGSFIWGIGWTFISGAHQAWLADEVGVSEAGTLYLRGQKLSSYGSFLGIGIAMLLGSYQVNYPYLLAGYLFIAWGCFAWFGMTENNFKPMDTGEVSSFRKMGKTFSAGMLIIRGSPALLLLLGVGVVFGTFSEGYDRLATAHLLRSFEFPSPYGLEPVVLIGLFTATGSFLSIALVDLVEKKVDVDDSRQIANVLTVLTILILSSVIVFALSGYVWLAITMSILLMPIRRVVEPLTTAWMNQHTAADVRATVLSIHSQSDALGQMGGGPVVGVLAREFGIRPALTISAMLLFPAIWLYRRRDVHIKEQEE